MRTTRRGGLQIGRRGGGRESGDMRRGGVSVCLSRFPISTPFMHSATPQEDFVCGFGVRAGRKEGGANRVKRMPHAMQACKHAAVMMTKDRAACTVLLLPASGVALHSSRSHERTRDEMPQTTMWGFSLWRILFCGVLPLSSVCRRGGKNGNVVSRLPPSHTSSRSLSCWRRRTNGICLSVLTGDGRTDGAEAASLPPPLHGIYNAAGAHRDRTRYAPSALASAPSPPAPPRSPPGWAAASSSAAAAVLLNPEPVITGLRIDHLSLSLSLSYSAPLLCMRQRLDVGLPVDAGVCRGEEGMH